jgi:hypothetical protein
MMEVESWRGKERRRGTMGGKRSRLKAQCVQRHHVRRNHGILRESQWWE